MRISTFFYTLKQGIINIFRNKWFSLASVATISACLFLFGLFYAVITNFQSIVKSAEEGVSVTIFFQPGTTEEQIMDIGSKIEARDEVSKIEYTSPEQAWEYYKENWIPVDSFRFERNGDVKIFEFKDKPKARYIKLNVTEGVGNYGSGRELYVFKVPGTESYLPGDINNDKKIDSNDLTSYMNYTGLRKGDSDFDYVSAGDINQNGLIDAYDISVVATQLDGGIEEQDTAKVAGTIGISAPKQSYNKDEIVEVKVTGTDLKAVNALSFALPYDQQDYEFVGIEPLNLKVMENLTYDRLHTNGQKALYPTFVNLGDKEVLEGTTDLFILKLKAKRKVKFNLKAIDGILVDKDLNMSKF